MNRSHLLAFPFLLVIALAVPSLAPAQSSASGKAYCYRAADTYSSASLRLEVAADGTARFQVDYQASTGGCGASGTARPTSAGWLYEKQLATGLCRVDLVVRDGGIEIDDVPWTCGWCGASTDCPGLEFPRSSQVDCASLPEQ